MRWPKEKERKIKEAEELFRKGKGILNIKERLSQLEW